MTSRTGAGRPDPRAGGGRVLAVAHRGDPVGHRENTLAAVRAAIEAGADLVEIDVKTTADGVSLVLHDDSLRRLWEVDRDIRTLTEAEVEAAVEAVVAGTGSPVAQRIPRLDAVLRTVSGTAVALVVDMDSGEWAPAALATVARAVASGEVRATQVVWCGHVDALTQVRTADPEARIFLSWGEELREGLPGDELLGRLRPEAFNPHWAGVVDHVRSWASARGLALSCWTVDDRDTLVSVLERGVDAVISNRVHQLVEEVARWNTREVHGAEPTRAVASQRDAG